MRQWLLVKTFVIFTTFFFCVSAARAAGPLGAQTITLDGQLFNSTNLSQPLLDANAIITVQILNPAKTCVLYEESQTVDTTSSNGFFNIQSGSAVGSAKRTANDPGNAMAVILQNKAPITATNAGCGGSYTPASGDARYLRIIVTPSGTGVPEVLSPDMTFDAVPNAMVAETLQGLDRSQVLQIGTTPALTQANVENVFSATNYTTLTGLLAGTAPITGTGASFSGGMVVTGGSTVSGGSSVSGGLNNNSGGITNSGSITGVGTNITGSGAMTVAAGGTNQNLTLSGSGTGSVLLSPNVGIGTTAPLSPLNIVSASGATSGSSYLQLNSQTVNPSAATTANFYNTYALGTVSGSQNIPFVAANYGDVENTNTGVVSQAMGSSGYIGNNSSGTINYAYGNVGDIYNAAGGTIGTGYGAFGRARQHATGTMTTGIGVYGTVQNDAAGTIGSSYGVQSYLANLSTGTMTNAYGVYVSSTNNGTIGNYYGLYLAAPPGTVTNAYSIFAADPSKSYFAGNVGIGTTTPGAKLEIASGTANVSGLKFTNFTSTAPTTAGQPIGVDASGNLVTVSVSGSGTVNSGTQNQLAWYSANGTAVSGLATANNGVLVTNASGVPAIGSTLPTAVQGNITSVGTISSGTWNGGIVGTQYGGTGVNASAAADGQLLIGNGAGFTLAGITGTANRVSVTTGAGSITLSGPQDIHTGASPTFTGMTLSGMSSAGIVKNSAAGVLSGGNTVALGSEVSGTLGVANGGTGLTTLATNSLLYGNGTGAMNALAPVNSAVLTTSAGGVPQWSTLASDTFTQYALLAGRAGGQSLRGGTAASESLTLDSTAHATKGSIILAPTSGNVGIGTTTPGVSLDLGARTDAISLPKGTTGEQPGTPVAGMFRYNTSNNLLEFHNGTAWTSLSTGAGITALTGDVTASGSGSVAATVAKVNGVAYPSGPSTNTVPIVIGANTVTYGAVPVAAGGTGQTTASAAFNALSPITTTGDIIYGSGANTSSRLGGNTTTTKMFLSQTGTGAASAAPAWGALASSDIPWATPGTIGSTTPSTGAFTSLSSTGYSQSSGNFAMSGTGTFSTGTGTVLLNGSTTVAAGSGLTMASGTGQFSQTYSGTGPAASITDTATASGNILNLSTTSTAAVDGDKALSIGVSGANASASVTRYGAYAEVTATGTSSTNVGGYFSASGASNNYGLLVANGNVGIGTTAPNLDLHVFSNANSDRGLRISNTNSGSAASSGIFIYGEANDKGWIGVNAAANSVAAYANRMTFSSTWANGISLITEASSNDIRMYTAGSAPTNERMRITSSGNVGIGTTTPGARFEVASGTANVSGLKFTNLNSSSPTGTGQPLGVDASGNLITVAVSGSGTVNSGTANQMAFYGATGAAVSGNANVTATNGVLSLGQAGSVIGGLNLNGNTSGTVSINPQAAAGTYNFNLPIDAGTGGQVLTSGGGAAAPMTWTTLATSATTDTTNASNIASGTLNVARLPTVTVPYGGTGLTSVASNSLLYGNGTGNMNVLAPSNSSVLTSTAGGVPQWSTLASDTFSQYALLAGRAGGQSLRGGTAASENLTLDSTAHATKGNIILAPSGGNVGIGTTTPSAVVEVIGTPSIDPIHSTVYGTGGSAFLMRSANGTMSAPTASQADDLLGTVGARGYGTTGFAWSTSAAIQFWAAQNFSDSSWGSYITLSTAPNGSTTKTERMRINSAGNVGIGTTSPDRLLHVNGPMRVQPASLPGTPAAGDIAIDSGASNALKYYNGSAWVSAGGGSSQWNNGASSSINYTAGSVGIGTSAPLSWSSMTVTGASVLQTEPASANTVEYPLEIWNSTSGSPAAGLGTGIYLAGRSSSTYGRPMATIHAVYTDVTDTSRDADLVFGTATNASGITAPTEKMRIKSSGNVGIDTTNPGVSLDVGSKTDAIALPKGTTAQQPASPVAGWIRYNTSNNAVEFHNGTAWTTLSTGGSGVTSVALSLPGIFSVSGSPVTTTGTLSATLANQSANQIFAGPASGGAATPGFRGLVAADLPAGGYDSTYIKNGGNSFGAAATIGTGDNFNFNIQTNGTAAIGVDTSQQVGIGTTSPGAKLDVAGQTLLVRGSDATPGEIRLAPGPTTGTNYVGFKAPAANPSASILWQLPAADGTNGQVLGTNGSGTLGWTNSSGNIQAPITNVATEGASCTTIGQLARDASDNLMVCDDSPSALQSQLQSCAGVGPGAVTFDETGVIYGCF